MDRRRYLQRFSDGINLPTEPAPGIPLVELFGDFRVLIERHQGVVAYDSNQIRIRVRNGQISVCGTELSIAQMTKIHLVICGKIRSVSYLNEGGCCK